MIRYKIRYMVPKNRNILEGYITVNKCDSDTYGNYVDAAKAKFKNLKGKDIDIITLSIMGKRNG